MDHNPYMRCMDIFSHYSLYFSFLISSKRHYHSPQHLQLYNRLFLSPQHHVCPHPPIFSYLLHTLLLFVRTFSPQFTCINRVDTTLYSILIWVLFSLSQHLSKVLKPAPLQPIKHLAYIASDFLVSLLSPFIGIHIHNIFAQDLHLLL